MTNRSKVALIFLNAVIFASLASHSVLWIINIDTEPSNFGEIKNQRSKGAPFVAIGSSLICYALDWNQLSQGVCRSGVFLGAPGGGSPEFEILQKKAPKTDLTIIEMSMSHLNENDVSDRRADLVPIWQTYCDLKASHADEQLAQQTMSLYPLHYLQLLFPTAGRSMAVMVGIRSVLRQFKSRQTTSSSEALSMNPNDAAPTNRLSDWTTGRLLRNLEVLREEGEGKYTFLGPKQLALQRMLKRISLHGKAAVLVLPDSPLYRQHLTTPDDVQRFESSIREIQKEMPGVAWIRLDHLPEFQRSDVFYDLMHLNQYGKTQATPIVIEQLKQILGKS